MNVAIRTRETKERFNNSYYSYIIRNFLYPIIISLLLLLILALEANAYTLSWNYKQDVSPAAGFKVYRKLPSENNYNLMTTIANQNATSYIDFSSAIPGTCYELSAYNVFGESTRLRSCSNIPDGNFLNLGVTPNTVSPATTP